MEFWNEAIVERSWEILKKISREFDFVLIGGWAIYLWSKGQKSRDIDIIIEYGALDYLKKNYPLKKNDFLKKYEIIINEVDIDIYLTYFSRFPIPIEDIIQKKTKIEGFTIVLPEILLILKQNAEFDRKDSIKGQKDRLDIINLLMKVDIDWLKYKELIDKYSLQGYRERLIHIIKTFNISDMNPRQYKLWERKILEEIG